ncbi:SHOCT domain-containing protein [Streptococcus fryi]
MRKDYLEDEIAYQLSMIQANQLLSEGLITETIFQEFKAKMLETYEPFMSQLVG